MIGGGLSGAGVILGVGQPFAGDDGVGPAVIDHLRRSGLPPGVTVGEVREPSALVPLLADAGGHRVVIVDAVLAEPAGRVLELEEAAVAAAGLTSVSSHGVSVGAALALARVAGAGAGSDEARAPDVRLVAVTIARAERGARGLSPAVAAAVPHAARAALAWVARTQRPEPTEGR
jgi:hydrogenase maturation protease